MPKMNRRTWLAASGAAGAALFAGGLSARASGGETKWKTVSPREKIRQRHFPNVTLTTHEGKKVRFYDDLIKDKIVIINFMYSRCDGVCLPVTGNLLKVQKLFGDRMGRDVFINSFTLKPEQDTPEALKRYAQLNKVGPGWSFITGTPADMERVRRKLGFVDPDPVVDADKRNHLGNLNYGNEPMMRWGGVPGTSKPEWIVQMLSWVDWPKNEKGERI